MKIISFTGLKRSGKTVAAFYLEEQHGYTRVNFKDELIVELKKRFPLLLSELSLLYGLSISDLFVEKPAIVRRLMQEYGTNVRRADDPFYWVKKWVKRIQFKENGGYDKIVVDDCRFKNEADAVDDMRGTMIKIIRDTGEDVDVHVSETEMKDILSDHQIENNDSIQDLHNKLEEIL